MLLTALAVSLTGVPSASIVAVLALAGFVINERRAGERALIPPSVLRAPGFVGANMIAGVMNLVGIGTVFVTTLFLQEVMGYSASRAGFALLPLFAPLAVLAPLSGRLAGRYGPGVPMVAGLSVGAAGLLGMTAVTPAGDYRTLALCLLALGAGMGLLTPAVVAAALRSAPPDRAGLASGVNNTVRQSGGVVGVAVFGTVVGLPSATAHFTTGWHILAWASAGLWIGCAATALALRRRWG